MSASRRFAREFSITSLKQTYARYIAETAAIGIDRVGRAQFEPNLQEHLALIRRKVSSGTYRFSQYKEKLVSKGANRNPRVISIPTFRDRLVLRALCNVFQHAFADELNNKIPQMVVAEVKEALQTRQYSHFAKIDIQNFYPSIPHDRLMRRLRSRVRKPSLLRLLEMALATQTVASPNKLAPRNDAGVPQGLAISNVLAEIYLSSFDRIIGTDPAFRYFRFVDDVLILSRSDARPLIETVRTSLSVDLGLHVHEVGSSGGKTVCGAVGDSFTFLGYQFRRLGCQAREESVKRLEGSLAGIFTDYKYKLRDLAARSMTQHRRRESEAFERNALIWRLNLRITGCIFEGTRKGWVFYFSQIDRSQLEQLRRLDFTVENLMSRFRLPRERQVKSFVRTYFEAKRRTTSSRQYIPNFDATTVEEQRQILSQYLGAPVDDWSDKKVQTEFASRIRRVTRDLEHDIQDIS